MFTLAVAAGNRGFLAIGDWLKSYQVPLLELFKPDKNRLPSYSTIRRILLQTNEELYAQCLGRFFELVPQPGETVAADGKVLKHSFMLETDNPNCQAHPAISLGHGLSGGTRLDASHFTRSRARRMRLKHSLK